MASRLIVKHLHSIAGDSLVGPATDPGCLRQRDHFGERPNLYE